LAVILKERERGSGESWIAADTSSIAGKAWLVNVFADGGDSSVNPCTGLKIQPGEAPSSDGALNQLNRVVLVQQRSEQ